MNKERKKLLQIYFLTLFPEVLKPFLSSSLIGRAHKKNSVKSHLIQIRDFALPPHYAVDDSPYGGGEGMLLRADILYLAWEKATKGAKKGSSRTIYLSPQGKLFNQEDAKRLSSYSRLIFVCGHYEGIDERFIEECVDEEFSIGNYVLTGGELAALVVTDAVVRLLPQVVGNPRSITQESLENHLLKYPQFTRPQIFRKRKVPEILLSGNHQAIATWRDQKRLEQTLKKRPDLISLKNRKKLVQSES